MSLTKATNSMVAGSPINVLDYGADPSGVNSSSDAFEAALAAGSDIVIPNGTYKTTRTINIVLGKTVTGFGVSGQGGHYGRPKIVPTSDVTGAAIELQGTQNKLENIYVDGAATTGVVGLRVGNVPLANLCIANNVEFNYFTGVGGKGLQIINTVGTAFYQCRFNGNTENVDIGSISGSSLPTTTIFQDCYFREAAATGVAIKQGWSTVFNNCLFEANYQAGLSVSTSTSLIIGVTLNGGWFEGNWRSVSGAALLVEAHLNMDGVGGDIENVTVNGTFFSGSATSERAIKANGLYYLTINAPVTNTSGGAGMIQTNNCSGWINDYRQVSVGWADTGGDMFSNQNSWANLNNEWTDWTPTITAFSGTYTSQTISFARYKLVGKTMYISLQFTGTTSGTPSGLTVTLPSGTPKCLGLLTPCVVKNLTASESGIVENGGADGIYIRRLNGASFGAGAGCGSSASFVLEIE
jgi:hypothetical protein